MLECWAWKDSTEQAQPSCPYELGSLYVVSVKGASFWLLPANLAFSTHAARSTAESRLLVSQGRDARAVLDTSTRNTLKSTVLHLRGMDAAARPRATQEFLERS